MTFAQMTTDPLAMMGVSALAVFIGAIIVMALADTSPTPEYTRLMAEHNARMAAFEADKPAREAAYKAQYAARRETMRQETEARLASWRAGLANKGE